MTKPLPPFSCTFSPNVPELLQQLNVTLAITTYQAGKVILISARDQENLVQLPRNFQKPMGLAIKDRKMAIATKDEVIVLANDPGLAPGYPAQPNTYDGLFVPRATYFTGQVDIHDIEYTGDTLMAVNTRFSCLCEINESFSFVPKWKPPFIDRPEPVDACHLNGMAFENSQPKYVTALGYSKEPEGWRDQKASGGILIDVDSGEIILEQLPMPHSPRIYNGELYLLLSATGTLIKVDTQAGTYQQVTQMNGFVRGLCRHGDFLFVGLSKLRKKSSAFGDLPIAEKSIFCGIVVIYLPKGSLYGYIRYENSVEEIYDVKVLPGYKRPGLLSPEKEEHKYSLSIPETTFWAVRENDDNSGKNLS